MNETGVKPAGAILAKKNLLGALHKGERGKIVNFKAADESLIQRFLELGLIEGSDVEVVHEAPFGKDPIAIRIRGALIALRRNEANLIEVEV